MRTAVPDVGRPAPGVPFVATCRGDGTTDVGRLSATVVDGATAATAVRAADPLKLLVPRPRGRAVLAWASTYGGGLVGGDRIALDLEVGPGARLLLATQSSTKVYKARDGAAAEQELTARVAADGLLALLPEPVCAFADARYAQRQSFALDTGASLVWLDGLVAGRSARGERWAFADHRTRTEISVAGRPLLIDATRLERGRGVPLADRFGTCDALATLVLLGPLVAPLAQRLLAETAAAPAGGDPLHSASPLHDGVILRLAGSDAGAVAGWIANRLGDALAPLLDHHHWQRKP